MGKLAEFLQDRFAERCPDGWKCDREVQILDARLAKLFGYAPQADVAPPGRGISLALPFSETSSSPDSTPSPFVS